MMIKIKILKTYQQDMEDEKLRGDNCQRGIFQKQNISKDG